MQTFFAILASAVKKLLTVKSIVTLAMAATFVVLALRGIVTGEQFLQTWLIVIGFYFGTQLDKEKKQTGGGGDSI